MKKTSRKLTLKAETIAQLSGASLSRVAGGAGTDYTANITVCHENTISRTFYDCPPPPSGGTAITCVAGGCGPVMTL